MAHKVIGRHDHLKYNPYWRIYDIASSNVEHLFFNSIIMEMTDISGFEIQYYISTANFDGLWGEDSNNDYLGPFTTKLVYEPTNESTVLNAFGITGNETIEYAMTPMDTFTRDLSAAYYSSSTPSTSASVIVAPKVGDLIKIPWNDRAYEIVDIGREQKIFQAKKFIWELILRPYRFSEESDKAREVYSGSSLDTASEVASAALDTSLTSNLFLETFEDDQSFSATFEPSAANLVRAQEYAEEHYGDNHWIEVESEKIDPEKKDLDDIFFNRGS